MPRVCLPVRRGTGRIQPHWNRPLRGRAAGVARSFRDPRVGFSLGGQEDTAPTRHHQPRSDSVRSRGFLRGWIRCPADDQLRVRERWEVCVTQREGRKMGKKAPKILHQPQNMPEGPSLCPFGPRGANGRGWVGSGVPRPALAASAGHLVGWSGAGGAGRKEEHVVKRGDSSRAEGSWPASCCHLAMPACPLGDGKGKMIQLLKFSPSG